MDKDDLTPELVPVPDDDQLLRELISSENTLPYLSETRSYAVPMPDSFTFRIMLDEALIGEAAFKSIRWFNRKAELSIYILEKYRSRGVGTQVLRMMINKGFEELDLYRLEAEIYDYNQPSIKLAEKIGFVLEGRLRRAKYLDGKYYDILRYGLLKDEYNT